MTEANEATVPSKKKLPLSSPSSAETRLESQDDNLSVAPPTASSPSALKSLRPAQFGGSPWLSRRRNGGTTTKNENEYPSNS